LEPLGLSSLIGIKHFHPRPGEKDEEQLLPVSTFVRTGPVMSRRKVVAIRDAHRMNQDASNSLLKILEEPQEYVKLVLTTDTVGGIAPTILSRCLAVACALPDAGLLKERFSEASSGDMVLAEGAPGRLKTVMDHSAEYRAITAFAESLGRRRKSEALAVSDQLKSLADKLGSARGLNARAANAETLSLLATVLASDPKCPTGWVQMITEAHRAVLGNGNAGIVFDALFSRILV
jgi:hypothetical protein